MRPDSLRPANFKIALKIFFSTKVDVWVKLTQFLPRGLKTNEKLIFDYSTTILERLFFLFYSNCIKNQHLFFLLNDTFRSQYIRLFLWEPYIYILATLAHDVGEAQNALPNDGLLQFENIKQIILEFFFWHSHRISKGMNYGQMSKCFYFDFRNLFKLISKNFLVSFLEYIS